ncbi:MAG: VOC family protein, partial [Thiomonas sp.]
MFTYLMLGANDLARAATFYDPVMAAIGHARCMTESDDPAHEIGWGRYADEGRQELALWLCRPFNGQPASVGNGVMIAFVASSRAQVDAFHAAALAHGGSSEGGPGLRPHYGPDFYA